MERIKTVELALAHREQCGKGCSECLSHTPWFWLRDLLSHIAALEAEVARLKERIKQECPGIEIEPGGYSGCSAKDTGANDCPRCGDAS